MLNRRKQQQAIYLQAGDATDPIVSGFELTTTNTDDSQPLLSDNHNYYCLIQPQISSPTSQDVIYYTIQPGDTLHNVSIKYSCPVTTIKRLNNIWSDQDFYGLSRLKLPAGKLGLKAEIINAEKEQHSDTQVDKILLLDTPTVGILPSSPPPPPPPPQLSLIDAGGYAQSSNQFNENVIPNCSAGDSVFRELDLNIEKARTAARSYSDNANAISEEILDPNRIARQEAETLLNDMSDYGLSYSGLILFIFIVCLICPLAYVIYLEERPKLSNHKDTHS